MTKPTNYALTQLLEKMNSDDTDYRYMATNDLINALTDGSLTLDPNTERRIVEAVLKQLGDKNPEVQNLAVKCLGPLVKRIHEVQLQNVIDQLTLFTSQDKEEHRDIANLGLKTVIAEISISSPLALSLCKRLIPKLIAILDNPEKDEDSQLETVDIVSDILIKFGHVLHQVQGIHQQLQSTLLPLLDHPRPAMRKRATTAIGYLCAQLSDSQFESLIKELSSKMKSTTSMDLQRTYIQCADAIARTSASKISRFIDDFVRTVLDAVEKNEDQLREACLQALETFILKCPTAISLFIPNIVDVALKYIKYDPNYAVNDEDEEEIDNDDMSETMDEDNDDEDDGDISTASDYSDDDDMSWKVRRYASKTLAAIIGTRLDLLNSIYENVVPVLISRFKEREESVRVDVLHTFTIVLKQTSLQTKDHIRSTKKADAMNVDVTSVQRLRSHVSKIVKNVSSQLNIKSPQTCQVGFELIRELAHVLDGGLDQQISLIINPLVNSLSSSVVSLQSGSSNLKLEALLCLKELLRLHSPSVTETFMPKIVPPVVKCIRDKFYKIVAEALLVSIQIIKVIRPLDFVQKANGLYELQSSPFTPSPMLKSLLGEIFRAIFERLGPSDADLEVKEKCIAALVTSLAQAGDILHDTYSKCLPILADRLRNEVTRLATVKGLTVMAESPVCTGDQVKSFMLECIDEVASLLRKNNRQLKDAAFTCLGRLLERYGDSLSAQAYEDIIMQLKPLFTDADLHLLPMALGMIHSILKSNTEIAYTIVKREILPTLFETAQSQLVQGSSLQKILDILQTIIMIEPDEFEFLFQGLTTGIITESNAIIRGTASKDGSNTYKHSSYSSIAKCVAVITVASQTHIETVVKDFEGKLADNKSIDLLKSFSLVGLGEIGSRTNLSRFESLYDQVIGAFSDPSEEVKTAAAFALGNVAVGNIEKYLPLIIEQIHSDPKRRYLLLLALKEIITKYAHTESGQSRLHAFTNQIWSPLFQEAENEDESTRNVTAECLGKLTLTQPFEYLPELAKRLQSPSAQVRGTVITAVKYTFTDEASAYDELLEPMIVEFLSLIKDTNLDVRRLSLSTLNSAAHHKPYIIREHLDKLMPLLLEETVVKNELIRTVEMGPFKMKVDDGLEARKTAYECMQSLIETCFDKIDVFRFLDRIIAALEDQHEIKVLANMMLSKLADLAPTAVSQQLDEMVESFNITISFKPKHNAVKQDVDKNDEIQYSTLRCIASLGKLNDPAKCIKFDTFLRCLRSGAYGDEFRLLVRDGGNSGATDTSM